MCEQFHGIDNLWLSKAGILEVATITILSSYCRRLDLASVQWIGWHHNNYVISVRCFLYLLTHISMIDFDGKQIKFRVIFSVKSFLYRNAPFSQEIAPCNSNRLNVTGLSNIYFAFLHPVMYTLGTQICWCSDSLGCLQLTNEISNTILPFTH